jgi:hypothetical protein
MASSRGEEATALRLQPAGLGQQRQGSKKQRRPPASQQTNEFLTRYLHSPTPTCGHEQ